MDPALSREKEDQWTLPPMPTMIGGEGETMAEQ